jgi:hypothetical protein
LALWRFLQMRAARHGHREGPVEPGGHPGGVRSVNNHLTLRPRGYGL